SQPPPVYVVVGEDGPDHCKVFAVAVQVGQTVLAQAEGSSKKEAERGAAAGALERLESGGD
ncbi:MAG: putative dsRNA-binding protein, partial [Vicinamibacterales bacterium]|nr:putative dsRNA-binding protein [Vicinamibacterales bacterium]